MEKKGIIYCAYNKINNKRYIGQTIQTLEARKKAHYLKNGCPYFHRALLKYNVEDWDWLILENNLTKDELNEREKFWIAYYDTTNSNNGYNIQTGGLGNTPSQEQIRYARNRFIEQYSKNKPEARKARNIKCVETNEIFKNAAEASRVKGIHHSHICAAARGELKTAGGYHWEWCVDISLFPNAIYCLELDKIYFSYNEARNLDNFSGTFLSRAFKEQGSPCVYAGYTFYKLNDDSSFE